MLGETPLMEKIGLGTQGVHTTEELHRVSDDRSHMPCGEAKKQKERKEIISNSPNEKYTLNENYTFTK